MERVSVEEEIDKALEAAVREFRTALVQLGEEAQGGELSFWEAEKHFGEALMSFACQMLAVVLSLYDLSAKYVCYQGEVWRRGTKKRKKNYHSSWGKIQVERWTYQRHGSRGGEQLVPLEHRAGLIDGCWTPQCAEAMARLVQSVPPREAAENVEPLGVLPYSRSSFERVALSCGQQWEDDREQLEDDLIKSVEIPENAAGISVAYDRVRIETDETVRDPIQWPNGRKQPREINGRMAYCATVTLHDEKGEPLKTFRYGRNAEKDQNAQLPGVGEWIIRQQVRWDVEALLKRCPELAKRKVALSDGGPELERIIAEDFPDWSSLCDLYHLTDKLNDALEEAGFSTSERHAKRRQWVRRLKHVNDAIDTIDAELALMKGAAASAARTYIDNRRSRLNYAESYAQGMPIASGHVEATCKSLVQVRMRRCGQRWTVRSSQAILNLRALALSTVWTEAMGLLMNQAVNDDFEVCEKPRRKAAA